MYQARIPGCRAVFHMRLPGGGAIAATGRVWSLLIAVFMCPTAVALEYEGFERPKLTLRAGTLGGGAEWSVPVARLADHGRVAARFGAQAFAYASESQKDNVRYKTTVHLASAHALLDWYPWSSGFRFSTGVLYNGNRISIEARPSAGVFDFNGVSYPIASVDKVDGEIVFNRIAPYLGIGWDWEQPRRSRFSVAVDLGVMYHGTPRADLSTQCGPLLTAPQCAALRSDVEAEEDQLNEDIKDLKWYPVFTATGSYRF